METNRTIGIVGLGLIGGSLAVDLRARGYASRFIGTAKNPLNAEAACRLGLVDRVASFRVGGLTRWAPRAWVRRPHPPWPRGVGKGSDRGQRSKTRPWRCSARPELSQERYTGRGTEIKPPS